MEIKYTDYITIGTKVEITIARKKSEKSVDTAYMTMVEDVFEDNKILMYVPISYGSIVRLDMALTYSMLFISDKGMFRFDAKIIKYVNEGSFNFMLAELLTKGEKVQRREYFRYRCSIPFKFEKLDPDESEDGYEVDKDLILSQGLIEDISGGGIRFLTSESLDEGDVLKCLVVLGSNYVLCLGKVLMLEKSENPAYQSQCRLEFMDMKNSDKDIIVKYIFSEQRRTAKKMNMM